MGAGQALKIFVQKNQETRFYSHIFELLSASVSVRTQQTTSKKTSVFVSMHAADGPSPSAGAGAD